MKAAWMPIPHHDAAFGTAPESHAFVEGVIWSGSTTLRFLAAKAVAMAAEAGSIPSSESMTLDDRAVADLRSTLQGYLGGTLHALG
jgi:hypothetical protein